MASGAGTGLFTGMFNFNTVLQGGITDANARLGVYHHTLRADIFVG
jgi:hypothetical protein